MTMNSLPLELQIAVFEHLCLEDLLSSALVCCAWKDVAWDRVMWKTCTIRLSGLLGVLFSENNSGEIDNDNFIPRASDLNQFLGIAAKTTSIRLDIAPANSRVKRLLEIADLTSRKVLFPALSSLDCGETPQDDLLHRLFVGSPIRSITFYGGEYEELAVASRGLLSNLLVTQPRVRDLAVDEVNLRAGFGTPEFWRLPELQSLYYRGYVTHEEWTNIMQQCPKLSDVTLSGWSRYSILPNPAPLPAPSLLWLNLAEFWTFDLTITIMQSTEAPHLKELDLELTPEFDDEEMEHLGVIETRSAFRLLAIRSPHLESLTLRTTVKLGVESLTAFRSLMYLYVTDGTSTCELDDDSVESLCRSLPNLSEFSLVYASFFHRGDSAKTTPKSFSSFARHCQDLSYLGLPVTATKPEDFVGSILTELVAFQENLTHLELTTLTLLADRTEDFVSFLIFQCPKLTHLNIDDLKIADQQIPSSTLAGMGTKMEDAYFKAQKAL